MTMRAQPASTFMVQSSPVEPAVPVLRAATPLARRFYQICLAMVVDSLAIADLTSLQMGVMGYLNKKTGEPGIDQVGLAARLGIDRNNTSVILKEMEERGLVERRVNDVDQRARLLHLTPRGEKLFWEVFPENLAANQRILAPLKSHEREQFLNFLVRVIQGNAAYSRPGAGRRKRGSRLSPSTKT
jgi:MarR family transcriptional regulator, lower aerobic nicotinate degradation pathway regulator